MPTTPRHFLPSCAALASSCQVCPLCFISSSTSLRQLLRGRPLFLFPWGFQVRACLVMLLGGFLSVWPIQVHFLRLIWVSMGSCLVASHSLMLLMVSGQNMRRICLRHLLIKDWIFLRDVFVVRHVSEPYKSTDFTFELKIQIFVCVVISLELQIFFSK